MKIHAIQDSSDQVTIDILKRGLAQITEPDMIKNYHPDYERDPANLFYLLRQGERYRTGNYYIAVEDDKYVGSAGWNWYQDDIALALTRAYVLKEYRQRFIMTTYFLPRILQETVDYNRIWCTCNEYNKAIYYGFVRLSQGKSAGLNNAWPKEYSKFIPIGIQRVNHTDQYVAEYKRN
jgi:hypothetical protein